MGQSHKFKKLKKKTKVLYKKMKEMLKEPEKNKQQLLDANYQLTLLLANWHIILDNM